MFINLSLIHFICLNISNSSSNLYLCVTMCSDIGLFKLVYLQLIRIIKISSPGYKAVFSGQLNTKQQTAENAFTVEAETTGTFRDQDHSFIVHYDNKQPGEQILILMTAMKVSVECSHIISNLLITITDNSLRKVLFYTGWGWCTTNSSWRAWCSWCSWWCSSSSCSTSCWQSVK